MRTRKAEAAATTEPRRVKRLRVKLDKLRSRACTGWDHGADALPAADWTRSVYGEKGAEGVSFQESLNGRLVAQQFADIRRNCTFKIDEEVVRRDREAGRAAYAGGERSSFARYSVDNDPTLQASRGLLTSSYHLQPNLKGLLWELSARFRRTAAQVYGEDVPKTLTFVDIDPRGAQRKFTEPARAKPLETPEQPDRQRGGVVTRQQSHQQRLYEELGEEEAPPAFPQSGVTRDTSWLPTAGKTRSKTRLYHREEIMLARRQGARCGLCPEVPPDKDEEKFSELIGPFPKRDGSMTLFVHTECAVWAPEVFTDPKTNQFRHVFEAYNRGRKLTCSRCAQKGATVGCYVESCRKTYHYRCLKAGACRLVVQHFVCFCPKHRARADTSIFRQIISAASAAAAARASVEPRDTTFGLDTAHSYFTGLRRGESELIFSLAWGVASQPNAENVEESVFSLRRRALVRRSDQLRIRDGLRVVKHTVFDIASNHFAFKMNKVYRHSSLAPPQRQRVFMVRSFRSCKPFAPGAIRYIDQKRPAQAAPPRVDPPNESDPPRSAPDDAGTSGEQPEGYPKADAAPGAAVAQPPDEASPEHGSHRGTEDGQLTGWCVFLCEKTRGEVALDASVLEQPYLQRNLASQWSRLGGEQRAAYAREAQRLTAEGKSRLELFAQAGLELPKASLGHKSRTRERSAGGRRTGEPRKFFSIYREIPD